jgi:GAF domain-containing protein
VIEGKLELGGALKTAADFESLVELRGDLVIGPSYQLNNLAALGKLRSVQGALLIRDNMQLRGLFLGALEEVVGKLQISGNSELQNVSLHGLRSLGALDIQTTNRALERVDLSGLQSLGGAPLQNDWQKALPDAVLGSPVY